MKAIFCDWLNGAFAARRNNGQIGAVGVDTVDRREYHLCGSDLARCFAEAQIERNLTSTLGLPMEKFIHRENIQLYKRLLAEPQSRGRAP
jgi:hypothetical protein